ncbi:MAG: YabP/YqfC family sporulation protein [Clostridiales bacterium]|jgi:sporulation protein YabP|nr:YabP/YqfC family sporulation protein [Clostridiales bacterium]
MPMEEQQKQTAKKHHVVNVDSRKKGTVSGVDEVVSYSDARLCLKTSEGELSVTGRDLKIVRFSTEDGTLSFSGEVDGIRYAGPKASLRRRLFQ